MTPKGEAINDLLKEKIEQLQKENEELKEEILGMNLRLVIEEQNKEVKE